MWTFHIRGYFHVCWSTSKVPSTLKPFWDPTSWRLLDRFFGASRHILKSSFPFNYYTQILCTVCVDFLWLYSDQCVKDVQGRMPSRPVLLNLINSLFHSFFTPSPLPFQVCVTLQHWGDLFFFFKQSSRCSVEESVTHGCTPSDYSLETLGLLSFLI